MTERLYYHDSHLLEFAATITATETLDDVRATGVILDRTAFYPTGGGQPTDTGTIDRWRVAECRDLGERGVLHVLADEEKTTPRVGDTIIGRVDPERRRDHLQQHTGQHILSQAFVALYGAETRGFRMLTQTAEIDVALVDASDERIEQAVDLANRIIWEDRPLRIRHVSAEEAKTLPLRKDSERAGELRLIEIEDYDLSPCGGTHAHRTGEVGTIAVRAWERAKKDLTRIEFVAGARALDDYRAANRTTRRIAALMSVRRDDACASIARLVEENKTLLRRLRPLEEMAARSEADELLRDAARRTSDDARIVTRVFPDRNTDDLKRLAQNLIAGPRVVALLAATSEADKRAQFVFARSADLSDDMNKLLKENMAAVGVRGGGSNSLAQGGAAEIGDVELTQLLIRISNLLVAQS